MPRTSPKLIARPSPHAVEDLGRDAGARVFDGHQHVVVARPSRDGDLAGAARGLDRLSRVNDRIEHDLLQLLGVARDGGDVVRDGDRRAGARFLECAALQREHPIGDLPEIDGGLHAWPLAGEVEQRLDDATGPHRLAPDHLGALLQVGLMRVQRQRFGEGRDRGQWIVELVRHTRHQRAELRQPVRLQQPLLQQDLARHVQRQEHELRRRAYRINVHDDGPYLPGRLAGEFERERHVLPPGDGLAQRRSEHALLRRGGPFRQPAAAQPRRIRYAQQLRSLGVRVEDLAIRGEHEGGRGQ